MFADPVVDSIAFQGLQRVHSYGSIPREMITLRGEDETTAHIKLEETGREGRIYWGKALFKNYVSYEPLVNTGDFAIVNENL